MLPLGCEAAPRPYNLWCQRYPGSRNHDCYAAEREQAPSPQWGICTHSDLSLASHRFLVQHTTSAIPQIPVGASLLAMASARTPHPQKRANPPRFALFASHPLRSQLGLQQRLKLRIDAGRTGPIASKLAPTGFSFSTRPQPSRKSLWERACSRWRPPKHHTLPSIHKKGRTCEGSPFCVCPSAVTAWPATAPQASPDPARTDECLPPASRSPSHLRWTTSGTAPR